MTDDQIHCAQLEWDAEGQPISAQFGDVYFSRANGLEETRHVFLQHNQLCERWKALQRGEHFTIAETGFGSGLNFLAAWELWLATAPENAQLHFVSVEKFPLNKQDLTRALALWPELSWLSQQLIANYPVFVETGFHRLGFMTGRIKLTLIIDDAAEGLGKLLASRNPQFAQHSELVDAWFLDGFAPAKNPQMWSETLFACIRDLSHANTTAATFSAAAIVKQGLTYAGFNVQKVPGFGRKREMVKAIKLDHKNNTSNNLPKPRSYSPFPLPWDLNPEPPNTPKEAIIIGGGLAGCTSARALAERGWKITLIERHARLAEEGSGNPQGVLYAKLSHQAEAQGEFNLACLDYALRFYRPLWAQSVSQSSASQSIDSQLIGEQSGVLQLAYCDSEQRLHEQLQEKFSHAEELVRFVDVKGASDIAGISLHHSALYFPQAGWINPPNLCKYLCDHPNINLIHNIEITQLHQSPTGWRLESDSQEFTAPVVIIANARDAVRFAQTRALPIKSIRGQITFLPQTQNSNRLKTVVCGEGYIGPEVHNLHCIGATFNLHDESPVLRTEDHQTNLDNLHATMPELAASWQNQDVSQFQGRVGFRCTLPDYLPLVGPVQDEAQMLEDFAPLRKNARAPVDTTGSYLPGLFINIGHGARGLAYTPLCAEILAAHINREPFPIKRDLVTRLHPARFLIRDLIKNKR